VAAILWLQAQPPAVADAVLRLEPQGRLLCSGRPGGRAVRAALSDGSGGHLLVTSDDFGAEAFPQIEGWDVGLIHLGADLDPLVLGDGVGASDPCGALVLGGRGTQRAVAALPWVPGTLLIAALDQDQGGSRVILQGIDTDGRRLLFGAVPASIVPEDNRCAFAVPPRHSAKKTVAIKTEINVCLTIAFSSLNKECNRLSAGKALLNDLVSGLHGFRGFNP